MYRSQFYAFTLIELMIVIAVIAILAGILVPNFVRAREEAKLAACHQNVQNIVKAIEMAAIRHPEQVNCDLNIDNDCFLVDAGYLKTVPTCPFNDSQYNVGYSSIKRVVSHNNGQHGSINCDYEYCVGLGYVR